MIKNVFQGIEGGLIVLALISFYMSSRAVRKAKRSTENPRQVYVSILQSMDANLSAIGYLLLAVLIRLW